MDIKDSLMKVIEQMRSIDSAAFINAFGNTVVVSTTEGHHTFYEGRRVTHDDIRGQYCVIGDFKRHGIDSHRASQWLGMDIIQYLSMECTFRYD